MDLLRHTGCHRSREISRGRLPLFLTATRQRNQDHPDEQRSSFRRHLTFPHKKASGADPVARIRARLRASREEVLSRPANYSAKACLSTGCKLRGPRKEDVAGVVAIANGFALALSEGLAGIDLCRDSIRPAPVRVASSAPEGAHQPWTTLVRLFPKHCFYASHP